MHVLEMASMPVLYVFEEELTKFLKVKFTESMMKSHMFTRIISKGWRDSTVVKSTGYTSRRPRSPAPKSIIQNSDSRIADAFLAYKSTRHTCGSQTNRSKTPIQIK